MDNIINLNNEKAEVKQPGFFGRVIGILVSPAETMRALVEKPRILFPLLAAGLGTLLFYLSRMTLYKEFMMKISEAAMAEQSAKMSADQMKAGMEFMEKYGTIIGLVSAPIGALVIWFVFSVVLFGIGKAFKGEGSLKQYLSIVGYAYVISLLSLIISVIVSFFTGNLMMNSSLTLFTDIMMPDIKGTYFYGFLRGIDLFAVWMYIVVAIGVNELSKIGRLKSYIIVFAAFMLLLLYGAGNTKFL